MTSFLLMLVTYKYRIAHISLDVVMMKTLEGNIISYKVKEIHLQLNDILSGNQRPAPKAHMNEAPNPGN